MSARPLGQQFAGPVAPAGEHHVEGTYWHPEGFRVRAGRLDDTAKKAFCTGQCHALAIAVHEHTGWPIVVAHEKHDEIGDPNKAEHAWDHAYVRHPTGQLLDANGLHEQRSNPAQHTEPVYTEVPADWPHFRGHGLREPNLPVARSMVRPLLRSIGHRV